MKSVVAVVDDDLRVLESLENLLESAGHTVRLFTSARALLDTCAFSDIDCLISDIGMPFIDGVELQRLAHAACPRLPVILITGQDLTARVIAAKYHCEGFFRKPFNGQDLLVAINTALSRREA
jgi:FixJ family two-component response regulator